MCKCSTVSELIDDDRFTTIINGSCHSLIICLWTESLEICTAYCGPCGKLTDLKDNGSVSGAPVGKAITVELPPATGEEYCCIVTGSSGGGAILFRVRTQVQRNSGEISSACNSGFISVVTYYFPIHCVLFLIQDA